jgi:DNA-binding FadR family transcriptional regulator
VQRLTKEVKAMSNGADYIVLYQHMETTARLMDVQDAIDRGDREAARQAAQRALEASRTTATMIEQATRRAAHAHDPR